MKKHCEHCANLRKQFAKANEKMLEKLPLEYKWKDEEEIAIAKKINEVIDFVHKTNQFNRHEKI